jgi:hypothetical protein
MEKDIETEGWEKSAASREGFEAVSALTGFSHDFLAFPVFWRLKKLRIRDASGPRAGKPCRLTFPATPAIPRACPTR